MQSRTTRVACGLILGWVAACGAPDRPTATPDGVPFLGEDVETAATLWGRHLTLMELSEQLDGIAATSGEPGVVEESEGETFQAALGTVMIDAVADGDVFLLADVLELANQYTLPEALADNLAIEKCVAAADLSQEQMGNGGVPSVDLQEWCADQADYLDRHGDLITQRTESLASRWPAIMGSLDRTCLRLQRTVDTCDELALTERGLTADQQALCDDFRAEQQRQGGVGQRIADAVISANRHLRYVVEDGMNRLESSCNYAR